MIKIHHYKRGENGPFYTCNSLIEILAKHDIDEVSTSQQAQSETWV
jgi:hypothetical protein